MSMHIRPRQRIAILPLILLLLVPASASAEGLAFRSEPRPVAAVPGGLQQSFEADSAVGNGQRLSIGGGHACAVLPDGDVACWGRNLRGELGYGGFLQSTRARQVLLLHDAVSVSAGGSLSCAARATGAVSCWGDNQFAQLGQNAPVGRSALPVGIVGITNAVQVAASGGDICVLLATGMVQCWGTNYAGQLGRGTTGSPSPTPATVPGISGAVTIDAGADFNCAVLAAGTARCWGRNTVGELGNGTATPGFPVVVLDAAGHALSNIKAVSLGDEFGCALLTSGSVDCWGHDEYGQLGDGGAIVDKAVFYAAPVVGLSGVSSISAAGTHACALLAAGTIRCWGSDDYGELGSGSTSSSTPVQVVGVSGASEAASGGYLSCARLVAGPITCWGANGYGALGRPTSAVYPNPPGLVVGNFTGGLVEAGGYHTCALLANRTVQCWGADDAGQLGNGPTSSTNSATPVTASGLSNVFALSAGTNHTCAIVIGGKAYCWGANDHGQIGNNDSGAGKHVDAPVPVPGLTNAIAISAGGDHSCAVRADQTAVCWGGNGTGQLGDHTFQDRSAPVVVQTAGYSNLGNLTDISAGSFHSCAADRNGTAWCWGSDGNGQLGRGKAGESPRPDALEVSKHAPGNGDYLLANVLEIEARYASSCAIDIDWHEWCWGWNGYGQLGLSGGGDKDFATLIPGLDGVAGIGPSSNHGVHVCAVLADTTARCWGANDQGQVGTGSTSPTEPSPRVVLNLTGAVQVSVGFQDSCALLSNGTAKCWGNNANDQLGSTTLTIQPNATLVTGFNVGLRALEVDAGSAHNCAAVSNGTARCWGANGSGRLGDGTTSNRTKPVMVSGLSGAASISAGGSHTCALVVGGTAKCWGYNAYGQLGDNTVTTRTKPTNLVSGLSGAIAISAGGNHTCALISNGTVKCWGLNTSGQLGDGTTTNRHVPVTVKTSSTATLTGVVAISAGSSHTCALLSNGTARCWGSNGTGRLGDGTTTSRHYATSVSGLTSAKAISAGSAHTCALLANGTAKCWGSNGSGRLGDGTTTTRLKPTNTVYGLTTITSISAGGSHTCAVIANGTARCWGYNASGQLGNGSTASASKPATVTGLSGVVGLSAGGSHTAAILASGGLRAWGLNSSGQVGDGTTTTRTTFRTVFGY
jgi:alpha-tubulin suppressor-like RCC1 family protein